MRSFSLSVDSNDPEQSWKKSFAPCWRLICCPAEEHAMQEDMRRAGDFSADSAGHCMLTTSLKNAEVMCQCVQEWFFMPRKLDWELKGESHTHNGCSLLPIFGSGPWRAYFKSTDSRKTVSSIYFICLAGPESLLAK